jgi:hypothetical protein
LEKRIVKAEGELSEQEDLTELNEPCSKVLLDFYTFPPVALIFSLLKEKREGHLEELYSPSCI